ncbi:MAG: ABC transporter permease, partial [Pseudomonadota bacterium]
RFPATLELALFSFVFVILLSSVLGFIVVWNRNKSVDRAAGIFSVLFLSLPNIWLGTLLIFFFSLQLHWFPVVGRGGFTHLVLPVLTLGLPIAALQGRVLRTAVLEVLGRDHCRFALAKGLRPWTVFRSHILKNALPSVISLWGITLGHLISGVFVVESIFSWPGLGRLMVEAVMNRDLPLIQGLVFLTAAAFVIINHGVEWILKLLDPRLKAQGIQTEGVLF